MAIGSLLLLTACVVQPPVQPQKAPQPVPPPEAQARHPKPPPVPQLEKKFQETGIASFYANRLHGRRTASGERYDRHALTAAHRHLPFGTWVIVRNLKNGRSVEVRINDRGPHRKGRIIDLSHAAAKQLGMLRDGVTRVEMSALHLAQ